MLTTFFSQHIVRVAALKQLFWKLPMICSFLLTKATCLYKLFLTFSQFRTIGHSILVHRLHTDFTFTDTVLQWFSSYLTDRTHYVPLSNHFCSFAPVHSGVPQGSGRGHIYFSMYIEPSSNINDYHSIILNPFALDRCLLLRTKYPSYLTLCNHVLVMSKPWQLPTCLYLTTPRQNSCLLPENGQSLSISSLLQSLLVILRIFASILMNLGFTLDCHFNMNEPISNIARTYYFKLRRVASIYKFHAPTATLMSAFISSRIDYSYSLLFGSIHDATSHVQWIQNYAERVILRISRSINITRRLKSLHRFTVRVRSTNKIAGLCNNYHTSTSPSYVTDMLHKTSSQSFKTRSSSHTMPFLIRPAHSKATLGD